MDRAHCATERPGVGLISPPPHHDIYSIEDLKQLIFDLKRSNPEARIHVKLVSQSGIGAVAAGVAKAKSRRRSSISGHDGGTGASPLNSLKHAGTPWELGLAEAQQTLMLNSMRERVTVQVDGQMKTGRDVIIAALLGAEEFGFATAPMVVSGCILMRVCHLDTCPVGVATQNPELRKRFTGTPEFVITFFEFLAQEVREYLAALGFRSLEEAIGHSELLDVDRASPALEGRWSRAGADPARARRSPRTAPRTKRVEQDHELDEHFDNELIRLSADALEHGQPDPHRPADPQHRARGRHDARPPGHDAARRDRSGARHHRRDAQRLRRSEPRRLHAARHHAAALRRQQRLRRQGPLGRARHRASAARDAVFHAERNVIAGNVIGYGATSGEMFIRGIVGERFLVRNSGATAVVEGVGDHALEYMTGGIAVILGSTGRNLGAGMSGGIAYVHDLRTRARQPRRARERRTEPRRRSTTTTARSHRSAAPAPRGDRVGSRRASASRTATRALGRFVKVLPRDYAAVLATRQTALDEGLDPDGDVVWGRILEVTGG